MNKIFKVVWSKSKECYVVVSEVAKNNGGKKKVLASVLAGLAMVGAVGVGQVSAYSAGGGSDTGSNSVAIGPSAVASGANGVAVGRANQATGTSSVALGVNNKAQAQDTTAVGSTNTIEAAATQASAFGRENTINLAGSLAAGYKNTTNGERNVAVGSENTTTGEDSIGIGTKVIAGTGKTIAIGSVASSDGTYLQTIARGNDTVNPATGQVNNIFALAIGNGAQADGKAKSASGMIAIGQEVKADNNNTIAIGVKTEATGNNGTAVGGYAKAIGTSSAAFGTQAIANGIGATAFGPGASAGTGSGAADGSVAVGRKAAATAAGGVGIGWTASASEKNATAIGFSATASGVQSVAIGGGDEYDYPGTERGKHFTTASGKNSVAVGSYAKATEENAIAFGTDANANIAGGVALGSESKTTTVAGVQGYNPADSRTNKYSDQAGAVGTSTLAAVSVGNGLTATRQITGVAAGTADTDAVNVAQLKNVNLKYAGDTGNSDVLLKDGTLKVKGDTNFISTSADATGITVTAKIGDPITANTDGKAVAPTTNGLATTTNVADAINASGWKVTSLNNGGTTNGTTSEKVSPGDTVTFSAGKNIVLDQAGKQFTYSLSSTLKDIQSIQNGASKITLNNAGGTTISGGNLSVDGNKITKVAQGTDGTDAVNVDQLNAVAAKERHVKPGNYAVDGNGTVTLNYVDGNNADVADTAVISGIAKDDLSNITNAGKKVITGLGSKVEAGDNVTVTDTTDATTGQKTYTVSANLTKVTDGTNTTVTGAGTTANPYKVNVAGDLTGITSIANTAGGPTMTIGGNSINVTGGNLDLGSNKITNLAPGTNDTDAVNYKQLKTAKTVVEAGTNVSVNKTLGANGEDVYTVSATAGGTASTESVVKKAAAAGDTNIADVSVAGGKNVNDPGAQYEVSVSKNAVKDAAREAVTVNNGGNTDNPITVTPTDDAANHNTTYAVTFDGDKAAKQIPLTYKANGSGDKTVKLDKGLDFTNGTNTTAEIGNDGVVKFNLKDTVALTNAGSLTVGDTKVNNDGLTISGGPSVTKNGIDAGNQKITNVAPGTISSTSTDAVNGSQLYDVDQKFNNTVKLTGNAGATDGQALNKANGLSFGVIGANNGKYISTSANGSDVTVDLSTDAKKLLNNTVEVKGKNAATVTTSTETTADGGTKTIYTVDVASTGTVAKSSWNIASDKVSATEGTVAAGSGAAQNIADTKTVTMQAGKNLTVNQTNDNGNASVAFALDKDLKDLTSVTTDKVTTKEIGLQDAAGNTTTIKKAGDRITYSNDGGTTVNKVANLADELHITPGSYEVGATDKDATAKNDEVTLTYTDGNSVEKANTFAKIKGVAKSNLSNITDDGKKVITGLGSKVKAGDNVTVSEASDATTGQKTYTVNAVTPAVYTTPDGEKLTKDKDGKFHKVGETAEYTGDIITSFENPKAAAGQTTKDGGMIVNNIGSAIKNQTPTVPAGQTATYLDKLKAAADAGSNVKNAAVNVSDLHNTAEALKANELHIRPTASNRAGETVNKNAAGTADEVYKYDTATKSVTLKYNDGTGAGVTGTEAKIDLSDLANQITSGYTFKANATANGGTVANDTATPATATAVENGGTINYAAGKNLTVKQEIDATNKTHTYTYSLDKDLTNLDKVVVNGKDGVAGKDGVTIVGPQGATGATGIPGTNGIDGKVGITGKDGKDAVSIAGKDGVGTIGLTGPQGPAGTNGKSVDISTENGTKTLVKPEANNNDQSQRIVYVPKDANGNPLKDADNNDIKREVATMDDGLKFAGDDGQTNANKVIAKQLNQQVDIIGGATGTLTDNNIGVNNDNGKLKVQLAKDVNLTPTGSLTTGDTKVNNDGITIKAPTPAAGATPTTDVKLTNTGLDNGGNKITNVKAGENDTDAVNVKQLKANRTEVKAGDNVVVTSDVDATDNHTVYTVNAVTPAVYTTPDGEKLTKDKDGKFHKVGETAEYTGDIITSFENPKAAAGQTTKDGGMIVNNIGSAIKNQTPTVPAGQTATYLDKLKAAADAGSNVKNAAVNVSDLHNTAEALKANELHIRPTASNRAGETVNKNAAGTADEVYKYDTATKSVTLKYNDGTGAGVTGTEAKIDLSDLANQITSGYTFKANATANGGTVANDTATPATATAVENGGTINYAAGKNLTVKQEIDATNKTHTYTYSLDKDLTNLDKVVVNGKDGVAGKDGVTIVGPQGATGATGIPGTNGIDGKVGITGKDGKDAVSIAGKDGVGTIGLTGPQGPAGTNGKSVDISTENGTKTLVKPEANNNDQSQRIVYVPKDANGNPLKDADNNDIKREVATMDDGLTFTGNNESTENKQKLGSLVKVQGEGTKESTAVDPATGKKYVVLSDGTTKFESAKDNIAVEADGTDTLTVKLNKNLKGLSSIQLGDNTIKSNGDNIEFTTKGGDTKTVATTDQLWTIQAGGVDVPAKSGKVNLVAGDHITITPDAANGKMTISATGFGSMDGFNVKTSAESTTVGTHAGDTTENIKNGKTVDMQAGKNLVVTQTNDGNGNTTVNYALNKDVDLGNTGSLKTGDTTINNDGFKNGNTTVGGNGMTIKNPADPTKTVSLTKDGLNNGGNQIKNVAPGTDGTDAVNVDQLNQAVAAATSTESVVKKALTGDRNIADISVADGKNTGDKNAKYEVSVSENAVKDAAREAVEVTGSGVIKVTADSTTTPHKTTYDVAFDPDKAADVTKISYKSSTSTDAGSQAPKKTTLANGLDFTSDDHSVAITTGANGKVNFKVDTTGIQGKAFNLDVDKEGTGKVENAQTAATTKSVEKGTKFVAGNNLSIRRDAINGDANYDHQVTYALNSDLQGITSITNNGGATMNFGPNEVSMTGGNLNMGDHKITNVKNGTDKSDVATVGQLTKVTSNDNTVAINKTTDADGAPVYDLSVQGGGHDPRVDQLGEEIGRVGAQGAALAALKPIQYDPLEPTQIMAGYGNYRGNSAIAMGVAHYKNESTLMHAGVSWAGGSRHMMANAGVTWKVGNRDSEAAVADRYRKGPISSAYAMQQEMASVKAQNAGLKTEVSDLKAENEQMKAQIAAMMAKLGM